MGYMRHHAIIVTSWNDKGMELAYEKASRIFKHVSPIMGSYINGYSSICIPPDGSKEGWEESNNGDEHREEFLKWLEETDADNSDIYFEWVEVQFGDDGGINKVCRASD